MQNKQRLPFSRHVQVGRQLYATVELLHSVGVELQDDTTRKFSSEARSDIGKAIRQITILQNTMENLMFASGAADDADRNPCGVYYGPSEGDA